MQKNTLILNGGKQISPVHNLFKCRKYTDLLNVSSDLISESYSHPRQISLVGHSGNLLDILMVPIGEKCNIFCSCEPVVSLEIKSVFSLKNEDGRKLYYHFNIGLDGSDAEFVSDTSTLICVSNLKSFSI